MISNVKVHENLSLTNLPNEKWKNIPNYDGYYQSSNLGRIKSLERTIIRKRGAYSVKEKIIKQFLTPYGYLSVGLKVNNNQKRFQVHQLVVMAFLNHVPCGYKKVVDHIDNNPLNNRLDNLQIITNRHNVSKDRKGGTSKYIGVSWKTSRNKWRASIYHNGKDVHLGFFTNQKEAAAYYQNALKAINEGTEIQIKRKINTSEYRGVYKKGNKWALEIGGKYIGSFDTPELANERKLEFLKGN